jgi:hypothetical protein
VDAASAAPLAAVFAALVVGTLALEARDFSGVASGALAVGVVAAAEFAADEVGAIAVAARGLSSGGAGSGRAVAGCGASATGADIAVGAVGTASGAVSGAEVELVGS